MAHISAALEALVESEFPLTLVEAAEDPRRDPAAPSSKELTAALLGAISLEEMKKLCATNHDAQRVIEIAKFLLRENKDPKGKALVACLIGLAHTAMGNMGKAFSAFVHACKHSEVADMVQSYFSPRNTKILTNIVLKAGVKCLRLGRYEAAVNIFARASKSPTIALNLRAQMKKLTFRGGKTSMPLALAIADGISPGVSLVRPLPVGDPSWGMSGRLTLENYVNGLHPHCAAYRDAVLKTVP